MNNLVDLIDDIKEKITDQEYRTIMSELTLMYRQIHEPVNGETILYRDNYAKIVSKTSTSEGYGSPVTSVTYTSDEGSIDVIFKIGADLSRATDTITDIEFKYAPITDNPSDNYELPHLDVIYDRNNQRDHLIESASFDGNTLQHIYWSNNRPDNQPTSIVYEGNCISEYYNKGFIIQKTLDEYGNTVKTIDSDGKLNCMNNEPSFKTYGPDGQLKVGQYHENGELVREIEYDNNGRIRYEDIGCGLEKMITANM